MIRKRKKIIKDILTHMVLIIVVCFMMLPLMAMIGTAFTKHDAVASSTTMFPGLGEWSLENFSGVLRKTSYGRNMIVSAVVSVSATILGALVSTFSGYALSRFKGPFYTLNLFLMLLMQMFPGMLSTIPLFLMAIKLGLVDHLSGLVLVHLGGNLGFNLMMMMSFYDSTPVEIEEAGRVDGATNFQVFVKLILPLVKPGIATISIMVFLNSWNEYTMSSLLLRNNNLQTLTVGMTKFQSLDIIDWGYLMAASTLAVIPALFFMFFAQKYLVQGLTSGAVKG